MCVCVKEKMPIRPLSKELQQKAIDELNEDPKRIKEDIKYMKDWLKKQPHIKARTDDQWLLTFLRGCKFSLERTKEKLDMFYTVRSIIPEFFSNYDPFDADIQEALRLGLTLPLRSTPGPDSPVILFLRNGVYDPSKFKLETLFKVTMMIVDILVNENDNFIISGLIGFQDTKGLTMNHLLHSPPTIVKKAMICFQDAYPIRPKQMHFYNIPTFFDLIFSMFKPFLKEKILNRIVIHSSTDLEEMYKVIPKSILPSEYGGDAGPIQDLIDYWKKKVESYSAWFKEEKNFGTDEAKRPGKPKTSAEIFGIEGSFRKLNVD